MTDTDTVSSSSGLDGAAASLAEFAGNTATQASRTIESVMARAFAAMEKSAASAAASGKLSIGGMVDAIIADCERIATREFLVKPVESAISSLVGSILPVAGARASGGAVASGNAYLVGEQGPELFVPASSGSVAANGGTPSRSSVVLNVHTQDAKSFLKSESQVAAMVLRTLARGKRNM
jgi:phage-related minor tail protein